MASSSRFHRERPRSIRGGAKQRTEMNGNCRNCGSKTDGTKFLTSYKKVLDKQVTRYIVYEICTNNDCRYQWMFDPLFDKLPTEGEPYDCPETSICARIMQYPFCKKHRI